MRLTLLIIGTLLIGAAAFASMVRHSTTKLHATQFATSTQKAEKLIRAIPANGAARKTAKFKKLMTRFETEKGYAGRITAAGWIMIVAALFGICLIIFGFAKKSSAIFYLALSTVAISLLAIWVAPQYNTGLGAAPQRAVAIIFAISISLGAISVFGADRWRLRRERRAANQEPLPAV